MKWNMYVRTVCAYIEKSRRMECCVLMPSITNESNAMLILPKVSGSQNLKILKISRCLGTLGFSLNWAGKSSKHGHPGSRCSRANEMLRYWSRAQQPKPIEWYPFLDGLSWHVRARLNGARGRRLDWQYGKLSFPASFDHHDPQRRLPTRNQRSKID